MITRCVGPDLLGLNDFGFITDTIALELLALPVIVSFILWRIFITNKVGPRGGITVLGLDDSSTIYSELGQCRLSHYVRFEYLLVAALTFGIGSVTPDVCKYLFVLFIAPAETEFLWH